jgi:RHS repeat-associated protein
VLARIFEYLLVNLASSRKLGLMTAINRPTLGRLSCLMALVAAGFSFSLVNPGDGDGRAAGPSVPPNRTLPPGLLPPIALGFTANPTELELFRARVFQEPLVPIGRESTAPENADLAAALLTYSQRTSPDDFSSLAAFLEEHPDSPWRAALLTGLGLEYYNTAYYSRALAAWSEAWLLAQDATDAKGKAIGDRAVGELIALQARLGHMPELENLLKSIEGRPLAGPATERVANARGGLAEMTQRPEISFRCGPLALLRIALTSAPEKAGEVASMIHSSASTRRGFSLGQVADLSRKAGLKCQMARRAAGAAFLLPSVVHWKVGHYAALVRQEGDRYLVQDPTFRNDVWATRQALEEETSGYFVVPSGPLPRGWSAVESAEGESIWGKGNVGGPDPGAGGANPPPPPCNGMAESSVDLLFISLGLTDKPLGYAPPVGPAVQLTVHYNQRDAAQPSVFTYSNLGSKWTLDWIAYVTDSPMNTNADVGYYRMGGFSRNFTGFNPGTQTFTLQLYDRTLLTRTSSSSYQMLSADGSMLIFAQPDGSAGTSRKVFLTRVVDPMGNALTLTYDSLLRLVAIRDAIGQVTTLAYALPTDAYKITKVTDPFGRAATLGYDSTGQLNQITDVIGITSQFIYEPGSDFIQSLVTPYGTTRFTKAESGTTRSLETLYPDGNRERFEFNQSTNLGIPMIDAPAIVPSGMATFDNYLDYRNTYYWSRTGCATGYGDYTKAKIYHWLHTTDLASASGILESTKEPLEGRVWYDYPGQVSPLLVGTLNLPAHAGRVLDNGSTQLRTYAYDGFGHLTNSIDPVGRTFSYLYSSNGIDLAEVRQTREGHNELLLKMTYNTQHLPLTRTDAAGQTTTFTYNARGQLLTTTNPKGEATTDAYDANGYLVSVDGPLPGTRDIVTMTHDAFGRVQSNTDVSGYTLIFEHDALDHLVKITHPDSTYEQITYDRLDPVLIRDRAGRLTRLEYDTMRQLIKRTDALGRVTLFQWCTCGDLSSITDSLGRTTFWNRDVQGRVTSKQYGDGSLVQYFYETATSRVRQVIDEKQQVTQFAFNRDDTLRAMAYLNASPATPTVTYTYDSDYERITSMVDGTGTTSYAYQTVTPAPNLGAGQLASVDGPLPNDTISYGYDELGRRNSMSIDGLARKANFDAASRMSSETNALGSFGYAFDGPSSRMLSETFPNGMNATRSYGDTLGDNQLQRITYTAGATPVSEFIYDRDIAAGRITTWSQQAGAQAPSQYTFRYDAADQMVSVAVTNAGASINSFAYGYDPAGNRVGELASGATNSATYNALNQLATTTTSGLSHTNEWDAANRLVAVTTENNRTEFSYDGFGRTASIRKMTDGVEISFRRLVWSANVLCEERDAAGAVTKRFFPQGVRLESGPNAGNYFYTRDHLGSIRELTDSGGNVRARYVYDPFGRRTRVAGDLEVDFGFTGLFWASEASLYLARFRAYDPELGRWLSRDPMANAELREGVNLYAYVGNNSLNRIDPLGLCCEGLKQAMEAQEAFCGRNGATEAEAVSFLCAQRKKQHPETANTDCDQIQQDQDKLCAKVQRNYVLLSEVYIECQQKPCKRPPCPTIGGNSWNSVVTPSQARNWAPGVMEVATGARDAERRAAETDISTSPDMPHW